MQEQERTFLLQNVEYKFDFWFNWRLQQFPLASLCL